jgi:hypothetical protein
MTIMNVTQEDAQTSLSAVHDVMLQTRRAIASSYANPLLILWGVLWIVAFTTTHFYYTYAFGIFMAMSVVGGAGTAIVVRVFHSQAPVKDTSSQKTNLRMVMFWLFLCLYVTIWLFLLTPFTGMQCNAFICTAVMFAYIVMGLWFNSRFMVVLGLAVTAATLVGYYFLRDYYCLWMALVGGGALFGTGLYIRLRWR